MLDYMRGDKVAETVFAYRAQQTIFSNDEVDIRNVLRIDTHVLAIFMDQPVPVQMVCVADRMSLAWHDGAIEWANFQAAIFGSDALSQPRNAIHRDPAPFG